MLAQILCPHLYIHAQLLSSISGLLDCPIYSSSVFIVISILQFCKYRATPLSSFGLFTCVMTLLVEAMVESLVLCC